MNEQRGQKTVPGSKPPVRRPPSGRSATAFDQAAPFVQPYSLIDRPPRVVLERTGRWTWSVTLHWGVWEQHHGYALGRRRAQAKARRVLRRHLARTPAEQIEVTR